MTIPAALADRLLDLVATVLADLEDAHAPGLQLPPVFGGHAVGSDARADLAFTLGLLHHAGIETVAGVACADAALEVVRRLDGAATHSFYSYRAAETLERLGGLDDNARLQHWTAADHDNAALTIDSTAMLADLDHGNLPKNYAVVLARCEVARRSLGRLPSKNRLDDLLGRIVGLLESSATGWWDDFGGANYDMYTPDVHLFAEPFAAELGEVWERGFASVLADLEHLATPGGAVAWGRSTGALGVVMNIELGAVALARELTVDRAGWLGRAALATGAVGGWFDNGVTTAHQHRMTMGYRGPGRRLQMTLDVLGKLVQAAIGLRTAAAVDAASPAESYPPTDHLVVFDPARNSAAWAHRGAIDFVLPLVGGFWVDYSPAPRWPGTFEVPVDTQTLVSWLPAIHRDGAVLTVSGPPAELRHEPGALHVVHEGFHSLDLGAPGPDRVPVDGRRRATYRVDGRSIVIDELLTIETDASVLDSVSIEVPEVAGRPLCVEFATDRPHTSTIVDTAGMTHHRSFWNEHHRVHELTVEPAPTIELTWRVTPALRVATTALHHWYDESLYAPLGRRVVRAEAVSLIDDPDTLSEFDVFHLHWPEWATGTDPARTRQVIERLRAAGVAIVWTQHNRVPHRTEDPAGAEESYRIWAAEADGLIHHSHYGRSVMEAEYDYGSHARHAVIPHGHWGPRLEPLRPAGGKAAAERRLGLDSVPIRLGVVGAPRDPKQVQLVLDAFHRSTRDDIALCVWSLDGPDAEVVPDDPRITAVPYDHVDLATYAHRLFALDALIMPFDDGMLTTGTVGDAVGVGLPALVSDWGYLHEALGDAAIPYGTSATDLAACIETLDTKRLAAAASASTARQSAMDWTVIAESTLAFFDDIIVGR